VLKRRHAAQMNRWSEQTATNCSCNRTVDWTWKKYVGCGCLLSCLERSSTWQND